MFLIEAEGERTEADTQVWASSARAVTQACLDGLRAEFGLDLLMIVVPTDHEELRYWISSTSTVDDESPELRMAQAESKRLFAESTSTARWGHYRWMRGRYVWLRGPIGQAEDRYGLVAARRTRLSPVESTILGEICRAVVGFASREPADNLPVCLEEMENKTSVLLRSDGRDSVAEVHATWVLPPEANGRSAGSPPRRAGLGRASSPALAVARGAAKAARPRCEVVHAGLVCDGSQNVGVALVRDFSGELRIGLATTGGERDATGSTSIALAVMLASFTSNSSRNEIDLTPAQIGEKLR